jgi:predicted kinase
MLHRPPRLIHINGAPALGKNTLAQRYIDQHALALMIDSDNFVGSMGQWLTHETEALALGFALGKVAAAEHLRSGHDVVLPHFMAEITQATELETIAQQNGARFFEFALTADKEEATKRLFQRGSWGEPGAPPLTQDDVPVIHRLYDTVTHAISQRPHIVTIPSVAGDIDGTYQHIIDSIHQQETTQ